MMFAVDACSALIIRTPFSCFVHRGPSKHVRFSVWGRGRRKAGGRCWWTSTQRSRTLWGLSWRRLRPWPRRRSCRSVNVELLCPGKHRFINICFLQFPNKIYTPLWLPHHSLLRPLWFLKPDKVAHCLNFKSSDDLKEKWIPPFIKTRFCLCCRGRRWQ